MSKKRGLSLEEKREKILQIFSRNFKNWGPRKQSVKDVVQSLVDDDLVSKDKLRNLHQKLEADIVSSKERLRELLEKKDELLKGREESDERETALTELKAVEQKHNELKEEMGLYTDNDPAALEAMKNATEVTHSTANRWTENIFTLQQWCSNDFPQAKEQLENMYKELNSGRNPGRLRLSMSATVKQTEQMVWRAGEVKRSTVVQVD